MSEAAGSWAKLGPWPVTVSAGTLTLTSSEGWANFSGLALWQTSSGATSTPTATATATPTPVAATLTSSPTAIGGTATDRFYRAINLNGRALSIDGHA